MKHLFGHIDESTVSRIAKFCDRFFVNDEKMECERVKNKIFARGEEVDRWHYRNKIKMFSDYYLVIDVDMQQLILDKYVVIVEFSAQYLKEGEVSYTFVVKKFGPNSYDDFLKVIATEKHLYQIAEMFNEIVEVNGIKDENSEHTEDASHL